MKYQDDCMTFDYVDERFADLQLLRYRLEGFEQLSLRQKQLIYYLSKATLYGRDITFDQFGKYNLRIRKMLEAIYTNPAIDHDSDNFKAMEIYLKCLWFSNGIYHHYGCEKFEPGFSQEWLRQAISQTEVSHLPLKDNESVPELMAQLFPVIFDKDVLPKRVNKADGEDLVVTSACNFYDGVTQQEAEAYYQQQKDAAADDSQPMSYGLNSTLVKDDEGIHEIVWSSDGRYANAIRQIVYWLEKAQSVAENDKQARVIELLINFYKTGDLRVFNDYCIEWVGEHEGRVDFINGFIEVYGDPLGLKGSWEGIVEYKDLEATKRTQTISQNAQWFEDHSPVDPRFRKPHVKGVTANAICAAMLGGEEYPSTAIGINLPNADWIRADHGSKSITISNITDAYNKAAHGNGFKEEFVIDEPTLSLIEKYGDVCDDLHTDLHECLGHGSGQLLPDTDPDALKAYGNTIEEARADLFGLYYIADRKLVDLGLVPDAEAYKSQYYSYIMNGLITQLIRIEPGRQIEEAHMRNRALIAHWCYEQGNGIIKMEKRQGKTFVRISDYEALRGLFARLLAEVQRMKSEGDYEAARQLVEKYAVKVDADLHQEVLARYGKLNLAPYKGFINPQLQPVLDEKGCVCDVQVCYSESYTNQMLRYSSEYATLV
jgi:dipeptidyl-peptidase-3